MTAQLVHAPSFATPVLMEQPRIIQRADQLDGCENLVYLSSDPDAFVEHQALDDVPGMSVDQVERQQIDDVNYEFRVKAIGIHGSKAIRQLRGYPKKKLSKTQFDEVEDGYLTTNPNQFTAGQAGSYGGATICVLASSEPLYGAWLKVIGTFRGIIGAKDRVRQISCNGNSVSSDSITVNLPGGWTTARKGEVEIPNIVVSDTICEARPPPTSQVAGVVVPPNAPAVRFLSFEGNDLTWHFPAGWRFTCSGNQLEGSALYQNTYVYTYQLLKTP